MKEKNPDKVMEPPQVCVFQVPLFEFFEQNFQMPKKCGCLSAWPVLPVMIYEMANLNKLKNMSTNSGAIYGPSVKVWTNIKKKNVPDAIWWVN